MNIEILKNCCNRLEQLNLCIAFIESASSGYLSSQFSIYKHSGADILLGGLVSYDPSIKREILKVDPALISKFSAESREVTAAMATQGKTLFKHADFIVACTGLLKPGGSATLDKPEGTFFICILFKGQLFEFKYFYEGSPIERLNQLVEAVSNELLQIMRTSV